MRIVVHTVGLLVVSCKMLDAGTDTVRLDTAYVSRTGLSGHDRVFRIVLEITSAQRAAHYVYSRSKQDIGTVFLDFLADSRSYLLNEAGVPGRCEQGADREMCAVVCLVIARPCGVYPQAGRTVGKHDSRNAKPLQWISRSGSTWYKELSGSYYRIVTC